MPGKQTILPRPQERLRKLRAAKPYYWSGGTPPTTKRGERRHARTSDGKTFVRTFDSAIELKTHHLTGDHAPTVLGDRKWMPYVSSRKPYTRFSASTKVRITGRLIITL
jgi:hypothetical protein